MASLGTRSKLSFVLVVALASSVMAGCGGDDGGAAPGEPLPSGGGLYERLDGTVHRVAASPCPAPGQCRLDADCTDDELCECRPEEEGASACVPASCQVDADCDLGSCARSRAACGTEGFHCASAEDTCPAGLWGCVFWPPTGRWEMRGAIGCE